jgi:hypothetical protein
MMNTWTSCAVEELGILPNKLIKARLSMDPHRAVLEGITKELQQKFGQSQKVEAV